MLDGIPSQMALIGVVIFVLGGFLSLALAFTRPRPLKPDARLDRLRQTSGQVERAAVTPLAKGFGLDVSVSYRIDGDRHLATRHSTGTDRFPTADAATAALADFPPGATVPVYYDPEAPNFGCLVRTMGAPPEGGVAALLVALMLAVIGTALALAG